MRAAGGWRSGRRVGARNWSTDRDEWLRVARERTMRTVVPPPEWAVLRKAGGALHLAVPPNATVSEQQSVQQLHVEVAVSPQVHFVLTGVQAYPNMDAELKTSRGYLKHFCEFMSGGVSSHLFEWEEFDLGVPSMGSFAAVRQQARGTELSGVARCSVSPQRLWVGVWLAEDSVGADVRDTSCHILNSFAPQRV
eukprot:TRINITY_DN41100_c0_g1_i1.p1 TRINITY_DN41100_c0_g1~~TRINITY_DN41100_c0_g1_i1.p1  ORF type:complete len:208 (+),score=85.14 TRINITY_DN41100_c0_g1_i1:43-624(+)